MIRAAARSRSLGRTLTEWLDQLWDTLTSVSIPLLILGLTFQTLQTGFVALAWRNILRAAYPAGSVTYRPILAYYAGGNALNGFLPASAGTVAMLGLFRANIRGATVAGLVGATVVENIFFAVMGVLVYLWLFLSVTGSFDVHFEWLADHWVAAIIIVGGGLLLLAIVVRMLWRRFERTWQNAKEGGAILKQPRKFMAQVVAVEALSYIARMGVNATFMYAFDIPVSVENVFLIVAAASISSTVAIAPGAVGAQTALASVVLKGVAPSSTISAYAIGQAVITTAWNILFGLTLLAHEIGWKETKSLAHRKKKDQGAADDEAAAGAQDGAPVAAAAGPDTNAPAAAEEPTT
jgi:uncharacterized membrane protein YbhN (UPF0104 family)